MSEYMSFFKNPCKVFLKYIIQKALSKFLNTPVQLTNQDMSKETLVLNDLEFNCQVLNDLLLSESDSPFKIVVCNVKKLSISNWLNLKLKRTSANKPIDLSISEVDIVIMPLCQNPGDSDQNEGAEHQQEKVGNEDNLDETDLEDLKMKKQSSLYKETLSELIRTYLHCLQLKVDTICIRIMTQEQIEPLQQIPTCLFRMSNLNLSSWEERIVLPQLSELHCLFNGKKIEVEQISGHLMAQHKIYRQFDYPDNPEDRETESQECPFCYPTINHPSTFLLLRGSKDAPGVSSTFHVSKQHISETGEIAWCLHVDSIIVPIDIVINLGQLTQIQDFDFYQKQKKCKVHTKEEKMEVSDNRQKDQSLMKILDSSSLDMPPILNISQTNKKGKQSKQKGMQSKHKAQPISLNFDKFKPIIQPAVPPEIFGVGRKAALSEMKNRFFEEFNDFVVNDDYLIGGSSNLNIKNSDISPIFQDDLNETLQLGQELFVLKEDGQDFQEDSEENLSISQVIKNNSRVQRIKNCQIQAKFSLSSFSISLLMDRTQPFENVSSMFDRGFPGQTISNSNLHLHHCDYFIFSVSKLEQELKIFEIEETTKINMKSNPFGQKMAQEKEAISKTCHSTISVLTTGENFQFAFMTLRENTDSEKSAIFLSAISQDIQSEISTIQNHNPPLNEFFKADPDLTTTQNCQIIHVPKVEIGFDKNERPTDAEKEQTTEVKLKGDVKIELFHVVIAHLMYLQCSHFKTESPEDKKPEAEKSSEFKLSSNSINVEIPLPGKEEGSNYFMSLAQARDPDHLCQLLAEQAIQPINAQSMTLSLNHLQFKDSSFLLNSMVASVNQRDIVEVGEFAYKEEVKDGEGSIHSFTSNKSQESSSEENFIVYEDDSNEEGEEKENKQTVSPVIDLKQKITREVTNCISMQQINFLFDLQSSLVLASAIQDKVEPLVKGLMVFKKGVETIQTNLKKEESAENKGSITKIMVSALNFVYLKEIQTGKLADDSDSNRTPILQLRINEISCLCCLGQAEVAGHDKINCSASIGDILVIDFTQKAYKIYNQLLHQQRHSSQSLRESFFDNQQKQTDSQNYSASWLCGATVADLILKHEKGIILARHSCLLTQEAQKSMVTIDIQIIFDQQDHFQFDQEKFAAILDKVKNTQMHNYEQINALFNLIGDLETDPMELKVKLTVRDGILRVQPLMSQKQDENIEQIQDSRFFFQMSQDPNSIKALMSEQTSILREFEVLNERLQAEIKRETEFKIDQSLFRKLDPTQSQQKVDFELGLTSLALDVHPVVTFKDYFTTFESQLKRMEFLTFNENLKFRISQRMLLFAQDIDCKVSLNQAWKQENRTLIAQAHAQNISVNILDQSLTVEDLFNPVTLIPGLELHDQQRPQLRLNDTKIGSLSYLESLGFVQIFLLDFGEFKQTQKPVVFDHTDTLLVQKDLSVSVKKVSLYLTKDSCMAAQNLLKCVESNLKAVVSATDDHKDSDKKSREEQKSEFDQNIQPSQLGKVLDNLIEDFRAENSFQHEGIESFQNIPGSDLESPSSLEGKPSLLFIIDQINDLNMRRQGVLRVPMEEMMKENYISLSKKRGAKQGQKESIAHQMPSIRVQHSQNSELNASFKSQKQILDSNEILQPKVTVLVHIQTIDLKLFQGADFDFKVESSSETLGRLNTTLNQSSSSSKGRASTKKNRLMMDDQYLDPILNQQLGEKLFYQAQKSRLREVDTSGNSLLTMNEASLKRRYNSKRGHFQQLLLRNIMVSSYRMKDVNFKKSQDVLQLYESHLNLKILYKFDKKAISIQSLEIRENITSHGKAVKDTFFLPYSYKYNNFCEVVVTEENLVKYHQLGLKVEFQPIKMKLRQEVVRFLLDFFDFNPSDSQNETKKPVKKLQKKTNSKQNNNQKPEVPVIVTSVKVRPFTVSLSYSSESIQINELINQGNMLEALNLFNINDLLLEIKDFDLKKEQRGSIEEVWKLFTDTQKENIMNNQKMNIVGAIGPLKGICNISSAFYQVLNNPLESESVYRGLHSGMTTLVSALGEESYNLRKKLVRLGKTTVKQLGI